MLRDRLGVCERWACRFVGQHRSTQRHEPMLAEDDAALRARLRKISEERPRWGYRRAHHRLCEERLGGEPQAGAAPVARGGPAGAAQRGASASGSGTPPSRQQRLRAERPNHVWAFDFQFDQTADGRVLKLLNVVDEFTREALAMLVERSIDADATVVASWSGWSPSAAPRSSCAATTGRS